MRTLLAVVLALILGTAAGVTMAVVRVGKWDAELGASGARRRGPVGLGAPRAVVDKEEYDFGTMDIDDEGTHDFVIRNEGDGLLSLSPGETSCRCTGLEVEHSSVMPGKSTKVTVKYSADARLGDYRQTATVMTNDLGRPKLTLTIKGKVIAAVRAVPEEVIFSSIAAGQPATAEVALYCYLDEPLEVLGFEMVGRETAEHFEATFEPLPAERLAEEPEARNGQLLRLTLKPGLPQGPLKQTILLRTNLENKPTLTVPVEGIIGSAIGLFGRGYDSRRGVLSLGTISSRTGLERGLMLIVKGPHRKEVKFTPVKITPELLKLEFGDAKQINRGTAVRIPLTLRIPPESRPANHLGGEQGELGEILLDTNHPEAPQLRILVRFAVEG